MGRKRVKPIDILEQGDVEALIAGCSARYPTGLRNRALLAVTWRGGLRSKEVLDLFMPYKLRLVLQGHLHYYESISVYDRVHFVTAGAVSARWWNTRKEDPLQEGFLLVHTKGDQANWEYVDYHWTSPSE